MKIFDMHADIGTDLYNKRTDTEWLKNHHLSKLKQGNIRGVFIACFFDGTQDWNMMQQMVLECRRQLQMNLEEVNWLSKGKDWIEDYRLIAFMSIEGMCGIDKDVSARIRWLYDHGVRIGSLVWNESNALASGWKQNPCAGLSELGIKAVKIMNQCGMIIDVSHINEHGFWDILSVSDSPVIATHSNARNCCNHDRNLTDQQIKAIAQKGGLIGLNAAKNFIDRKKENQDALHLAKHARYMADLVGIEYIACGFDFMDYMEEDAMAYDLKDATESSHFIDALYKVGFTVKEIEQITWKNVKNFIIKNIDENNHSSFHVNDFMLK